MSLFFRRLFSAGVVMPGSAAGREVARCFGGSGASSAGETDGRPGLAWRRGRRVLLGLVAAFVLLPAANAAANTVTISLAGSGLGTVTGGTTADPTGIDCSNVSGALGPSCTHDFPSASTVTLSATAGQGFGFVSWSGQSGVFASTCSGATTPCHFILTGTGALTANFGPPPPTVVTGSATNLSATGGTLHGTVNPNGAQVTACHFDYGTTTSYGQSAPCAETVGSGASAVAVHADLTGLTSGTTYHYRLAATSANGTGNGGDQTFKTVTPPVIDAASASGLTGSSVDLNAEINTNRGATTYHFEYGTTTAYGTSVPVPDAQIAGASSDVHVVQHVTGLEPDVTYHWRVVAANSAAPEGVDGPDNTFVYDTSGGGLPDNRAYELVSPPAKNGALLDVGFPIFPPVVSADGSRVVAHSIQCFGASESCTGQREFNGQPYAFTRTASGWQATPLAPPATMPGGTVSDYGAVADTGAALFSAPTAPAGEDDWYVRKPDGSVGHIGPAYPPAAGALGFPNTGNSGATPDYSHILYTLQGTVALWPFDNTQSGVGLNHGAPSLYEYVGTGNSQPALVGVTGGLGSTDLISDCGTTGELRAPMSVDGSIVFFTALACSSGSGANAGKPVPSDELWARIDGSRSVLISTGGSFVGASNDGSKAFYDPGGRLFLYDFDNPAGQNTVDVSGQDASGGPPRVAGVVAISADGSTVYFVAQGVLTSEANDQGHSASEGADNLYVYQRDAAHPSGHLAFIATLPASDSSEWCLCSGLPPIANVTPDGRFLVFTSHGDLTPDDNSTTGAAQVFRYDAQTGQLVRVSIGARGFNDNGNAGTGDATLADVSNWLTAGYRRDPTMSDDGSYVFFQSPVGLTPQALDDATDTSGTLAQNVYEWEPDGTGGCTQSAGCVHLISDGRDTSSLIGGQSSVQLLGTDAHGQNVFFATTAPLVAQDTDTQLDYYDARIGGGFPSTPPPAGCQGDACQPNPSTPPPAVVAASVTFTGPDNATPGSAATKPKVLTRTVRGAAFVVKVKVPGQGRVTVTGAGIRTVRRSVSKAGTYHLRVALTAKDKRLLARQHKLRLSLRVAYAPPGVSAQAARVLLTVKPALRSRTPHAGRAKRTAGRTRGGAR